MDWSTVIAEQHLTALELEAKYFKCDYHPVFWKVDWANANSRLKYWDWVAEQIAKALEELDRDNPYNL